MNSGKTFVFSALCREYAVLWSAVFWYAEKRLSSSRANGCSEEEENVSNVGFLVYKRQCGVLLEILNDWSVSIKQYSTHLITWASVNWRLIGFTWVVVKTQVVAFCSHCASRVEPLRVKTVPQDTATEFNNSLLGFFWLPFLNLLVFKIFTRALISKWNSPAYSVCYSKPHQAM